MKLTYSCPSTCFGLLKWLNNLGFIADPGGKHAYKFRHPVRHAKKEKRDFITLSTHNVDKNFCKIVIENEVMGAFGFTEEEVAFCVKKPLYKMPKRISLGP
jgi:hypothetical protein